MVIERRKHKRAKAPKVQIATYNDSKPIYGRVHDIDPDGMCIKLDTVPTVHNTIDIILRMFKKDLRFRGNIVRFDQKNSTVFVAMLFDWVKTPSESKMYLDMYLNQ